MRAADILGRTMTSGQTIPESGRDLEDRRVAPETVEWTRRRWRQAPIAAFLSFVFPGAGQLYNHQPRLAAAFGVPVAVLVLVAVVGALTSREALVPRLLDNRVVMGLIAVNLAILVWRVASMLQAHRRRARLRPTRVGTLVTASLVVVAIVLHTVPTTYGVMLLETLSAISSSDSDGSSGLRNSIPALRAPAGGPLPEASRQPGTGADEHLNVLLVGVDSDVGRDHALTDTMLVVGIDPDGTSAMLSIPRDLVNVPLPDGEPYPHKLNSLLQNASADPARYPLGGVATLKATIGNLLGVRIHYFAAVDMAGFRRVIDAIGGVEVNVEVPVADPMHNFYLDPGRVFMDGDLALQYVRSRYGPANDDFQRAARQQQVVAAIRDSVTAADLLGSLPALLHAVQNTIATDVAADRIADLAVDIQAVDMSTLRRAVLEPPDYVTPQIAEGGAYVLIPDLARIRALGQELLGS